MPLDFKDTISGNEGTAFIEVDGTIKPLFYLKRIEARMETTKIEGKTLGRRATQHKKTGWVGTGTLLIHKVTSDFIEMAHRYHKTGQDTYFSMTVSNEDPTSTIGKQTVIINGCNLDEYPILLLDSEAEALEEEMPFTFDDFEPLEKFATPAGL